MNLDKTLIILLVLAVAELLPVWFSWHALKRVGLSPWLGLIALIGGLGTLIVLGMIAYADLPALPRASD